MLFISLTNHTNNSWSSSYVKGDSEHHLPELLKILMEMGHGDEIVIGDGNFPAQSMGQRVVRLRYG